MIPESSKLDINHASAEDLMRVITVVGGNASGARKSGNVQLARPGAGVGLQSVLLQHQSDTGLGTVFSEINCIRARYDPKTILWKFRGDSPSALSEAGVALLSPVLGIVERTPSMDSGVSRAS